MCSGTFYSRDLDNNRNQELLTGGAFGLYINLTLFPKFLVECAFEHICMYLSGEHGNTVGAYSFLNSCTSYKQ